MLKSCVVLGKMVQKIVHKGYWKVTQCFIEHLAERMAAMLIYVLGQKASKKLQSSVDLP